MKRFCYIPSLNLRVALFASTLVGTAVGMGSARASSLTPYPFVFAAGSPAEQSILVKNAGSTFENALRHAERGQFWVYGFAVAPGARCRLTLTLDGDAASVPPAVTILGTDNKPLALKTEQGTDGAFVVVWTVPDKWPAGSRLSVLLSAKDGAVNVRAGRLAQTLADNNGDGLPDSIARLLTAGMPPNARLNIARPITQPYTVTLCAQPITPALDVQTDAIFADLTDSAGIGAWKERGYSVWTPGDARAGRDFAANTSPDTQTGRDGKPILIGGRALLATTPAVQNADRSLFETALGNGSDGVCFQEPEYAASAGYGAAFKQDWQTQFGAAWQNPLLSVDTRYHAASLMATRVANRVQSLLQFTFGRKPATRRMVLLHSPLYLAQSELVSPVGRIAGLNEVTDIIGDVGMDTASLTARYAGLRQDLTFARAYLEYSALYHAARGLNKRVWFLTDPTPPSPATPDANARYEQTLAAALLLPDVNAYQLVLPPDSLTSNLPPDEQTRLHSLLAVLEDMHNQTGISGNAEKDDDIGVLISDTAQWQRGGPSASDLDGVFGLCLPLLQRGVPVQALSLERAADPAYLNGFRTLILSYDFQKPPGPRAQQALSEWVRRGGSLIYVGGTDAFNGVTDAWWRQTGYVAPQQDLWKQLGLNVGIPAPRFAPQEDAGHYTEIAKSQAAVIGGERTVTLDLTPYARQTGSVVVRFASRTPGSSPDALSGASLQSGELSVDGRVAASFTAGSEIENRFLAYDNLSQFDGRSRTAEGGASWTYQFDNLPRDAPITLAVNMAGSYIMSGASARPDFGHTLLSTGVNMGLSKAFPRLRIGASYPVTLYDLPGVAMDGAANLPPDLRVPPTSTATASNNPARIQSGPGRLGQGRPGRNEAGSRRTAEAAAQANQPSVLYTLRAGGAPVWMQNVGRGLIMNVGVAPGFFSASERSAGLLRALTRFAHQRAGGAYREPGVLRLRRGRYTIVRTFAEPTTVEGRMIDLLSPTLNVGDDRVIAPNSTALLYDLGVPEAEPHIGFVAGRVQAKAETSTATAFYVRGAAGTTGAARLHRGNRRLVGARGMDWLGRPVPVQANEEGGTVVLRYANDPDGVIIRVGWQ